MSNDATDIDTYYPTRTQVEAIQRAIDTSFPDRMQPVAQAHDTIQDVIDQFCSCSLLTNVTVIDSTHLRVTFDRPVLDNPAIRAGDIYEIVVPAGSGPVTVLSVVPEGSPNIVSLLLTTTEHRSLPDYIVRIHHLEAAP